MRRALSPHDPRATLRNDPTADNEPNLPRVHPGTSTATPTRHSPPRAPPARDRTISAVVGVGELDEFGLVTRPDRPSCPPPPGTPAIPTPSWRTSALTQQAGGPASYPMHNFVHAHGEDPPPGNRRSCVPSSPGIDERNATAPRGRFAVAARDDRSRACSYLLRARHGGATWASG